MDAYHSRGREEERRKRLQERREKLRRLLKEEKENLQVYSWFIASYPSYPAPALFCTGEGKQWSKLIRKWGKTGLGKSTFFLLTACLRSTK